jgi:ATP-dependent Clp protease ATP-binding subunit ClpC
VKTLTQVAEGALTPTPQPETGISLAPKFKKEASFLNRYFVFKKIRSVDAETISNQLMNKMDFEDQESVIGKRQLEVRDLGETLILNIEKEKALAKSILDKALKNKFQPEFLNRVDDIIIFDSLEKAEIGQILEIELKDLLARSLENGYTFELDQLAKDFIIEHGYDEKYGARPIKRMVQNHVEDLLAELWIDSKLKDNGHVNITISEDGNGLKESSIEDRSR